MTFDIPQFCRRGLPARDRVAYAVGTSERRRRGIAMNDISLDVQKVSAGYGRGARRTEALQNVSLTVERGEIFGLLGPNGAGKTTLLACLEGLHTPDAGTVRVGGVDVQKDPARAKRKLGVQLQKTALLDDLTVAE